MSSLFSKALVYLGLVDEDEFDHAAEQQGMASASDNAIGRNGIESMPEGRRVEPPPTSRTATRPQGLSESVVAGGPMVRSVEIQSDILVVEDFTDARVLADRIRERTPVVLDMRQADQGLVRRVVDFSSGLIYALDGSMRRVGDGLVVVLPPRAILSRDEKRRLASLGAYELDDVD